MCIIVIIMNISCMNITIHIVIMMISSSMNFIISSSSTIIISLYDIILYDAILYHIIVLYEGGASKTLAWELIVCLRMSRTVVSTHMMMNYL